MHGRDGLDYAGVRAYLDEQGLSGDERRELFASIQAAESASLQVWSEHQLRKQREAEQAQQQTGRSGRYP